MRILLIAYEFPPSPSPQSLRWAYLAGRLAELGHEMHVMTPDIAGNCEGLPELPDVVVLHRVFPGPVRALLSRLAARRPASSTPSPGEGADAVPPSLAPPRLNWKGRLLETFQAGVAWMLFPDLRGEWKRPALRSLRRTLERVRPDLVISSHEPATTLELGLHARHLGYRWMADLGDPVLASYTPARWRRRAGKLERDTLLQTDRVLVTTDAAVELLASRHGVDKGHFSVIPQGFDEQLRPAGPIPLAQGAPTELLYGGSFYSFRSPMSLVHAVIDTGGVRLNIASGNVPESVIAAAARHPDRIRLLGRVPHRELLRLQRDMHVLVNIANQDATQVPGKLYEYFGAGRPILHIQAQPGDATGLLLARLQRGWSTSGEPDAIAMELKRIRQSHEQGTLESGLDLSPEPVSRWSWSTVAESLQADLPRSAVEPGVAA